MADLKLTDDWATGIYQLEEADLVLGGPDGIDNRQAKELGERTNYLRKHGIAQWSATIAYDVDCYVKHSGGLWRSKRVCLNKEPGKSADDWEVLTLPLSQLDARYHAKDGQLAWSKVTATPTTLAGYGITDTPWAQPLGNLSNTLSSKADSARVDQEVAGLNKTIKDEVARLLPTEAASAKYLPIDAAKKTYVAIADTYDLSARDDFGVAVEAGTANTLYTPNITKPRGVYLVQPYNNSCKTVLVGGGYYLTAFGEFISGGGSSGAINMTPVGGPSYDQPPFVVRVTSASATFRFGLGVRGNGPAAQGGTVTITPGINHMSFNAHRIG